MKKNQNVSFDNQTAHIVGACLPSLVLYLSITGIMYCLHNRYINILRVSFDK